MDVPVGEAKPWMAKGRFYSSKLFDPVENLSTDPGINFDE